jgi:hypothetical protein
VRIRLDPEDEYMHEVEAASTFNESMYFNVYDPSTRLGGFFRLGNRPNEGYAEMTLCLYLPDGRVVFMFDRPKIAGNEFFDAGGMRFDVVRPFEELRVAFEGKAVVLEDPLAMADPKTAFTTSPWTAVDVDLTFTGVSPMFGGEPEGRHEAAGEEFARGHYEQLMAGTGSVRVGDDDSLAFAVDGFGLRDHSWGPRTWQAPWYYRWCTANAGPDFGFMASRVARRDKEGTRGGFVWDGTALHLVDSVEISTAWSGEESYHETVSLALHSGDRTWSVEGRVLSLIPLRNRREGSVTRISEGLTEWRVADGPVAYGLSEYLDQIIDGEPVGIAE